MGSHGLGGKNRGQRITSTPAVSWSVGDTRERRDAGQRRGLLRLRRLQRPPKSGADGEAPPSPYPSPRPGALPSPSGQTGQHSPGGATAPGQFLVSSQITSSHSTLPLSQTQIRQTSGFHTSRSWYLMPFCTQVTGGTEARRTERRCQRRPRLPPRGSRDPNPSAHPLYLRDTFRFSISRLLLPLPFPTSLKVHLLLISASDNAEAPGQGGYNSFQFSGI